MITLKAALIAASAIGTVAMGGGATWAMTGSHQEAGLQSQSAKAPAERTVRDALHGAVPAAPPACLPAKPALPGAKLPDAGAAKKKVERHLEQNPATGDLPQGRLPKTGDLPDAGVPKPGVPKAGVPKAELPKAGVPGVKAPDGSTGPSANLPACPPNPKDIGKGVPAAPGPGARVPAEPGLPGVPKADCGTLKPAVPVGGPVEKTLMLAKGLRHAGTVQGTPDLRGQDVCAVTQKWTGAAGRWITVETLRTPAGMTQNQLRRALRLPRGGSPITVSGSAGWLGAGGGGVLVFDPNGHSLFVNGSPVFAGGLRDLTTALRQAR